MGIELGGGIEHTAAEAGARSGGTSLRVEPEEVAFHTAAQEAPLHTAFAETPLRAPVTIRRGNDIDSLKSESRVVDTPDRSSTVSPLSAKDEKALSQMDSAELERPLSPAHKRSPAATPESASSFPIPRKPVPSRTDSATKELDTALPRSASPSSFDGADKFSTHSRTSTPVTAYSSTASENILSSPKLVALNHEIEAATKRLQTKAGTPPTAWQKFKAFHGTTGGKVAIYGGGLVSTVGITAGAAAASGAQQAKEEEQS